METAKVITKREAPVDFALNHGYLGLQNTGLALSLNCLFAVKRGKQQN
jgi:hypothetical protein